MPMKVLKSTRMCVCVSVTSLCVFTDKPELSYATTHLWEPHCFLTVLCFMGTFLVRAGTEERESAGLTDHLSRCRVERALTSGRPVARKWLEEREVKVASAEVC